MKTGSFLWWAKELAILAGQLALGWAMFTLAVTFLLFLLGL
jgi:hypothetical protein